MKPDGDNQDSNPDDNQRVERQSKADIDDSDTGPPMQHRRLPGRGSSE